MGRRSIKCSDEVYLQIREKQNLMEKRVTNLTGLKKIIPLNKVLKVYMNATPSVYIKDENLLRMAFKRRRKNKRRK